MHYSDNHTLQQAFNAGVAFAIGRNRVLMAYDSPEWITVHPNGAEHKGRPALIDNATGEVLGGMGGKFTGRHISAVKQGGKFEQMGAQMNVNRVNHKPDMMNGQNIPFQSVNNPANIDPANVENKEKSQIKPRLDKVNQGFAEKLNELNLSADRLKEINKDLNNEQVNTLISKIENNVPLVPRITPKELDSFSDIDSLMNERTSFLEDTEKTLTALDALYKYQRDKVNRESAKPIKEFHDLLDAEIEKQWIKYDKRISVLRKQKEEQKTIQKNNEFNEIQKKANEEYKKKKEEKRKNLSQEAREEINKKEIEIEQIKNSKEYKDLVAKFLKPNPSKSVRDKLSKYRDEIRKNEEYIHELEQGGMTLAQQVQTKNEHNNKVNDLVKQYKENNKEHTPEQQLKEITNIIKSNKDPNIGYSENDIMHVGDAYFNVTKDHVNNLVQESIKNSEELAEKEKIFEDARKQREEIFYKKFGKEGVERETLEKQYEKLDKETKIKGADYYIQLRKEAEYQEKNAEIMKNELSKNRQICTLDTKQIRNDLINNKDTSQNADILAKGLSFLPQEWIDTIKNSSKITLKKGKRRGYCDGFGDISLGEDYSSNGHSQLTTAIHELGHRMERDNPNITKLEREFYDRRTKGEDLKWLGHGFNKNEKTRKDNFLDPYMGKDYGSDAFELLSMGMQMYFTEPQKLMKDPDMYKFISGILLTV